MPPTVSVPRVIKVRRLTEVLAIKGTGVYLHWSVLVICALILAGVSRRPVQSILGMTAYLSVLLIHEGGHLLMARRKGCDVSAIELYPIFAITRYSMPWSDFDHAVIAWGGVLAQAIVAVPLVMFVAAFGYTRWEPLNEVFAILGFFSIGVAIFNLLPFPPLDGATAWRIVPLAVRKYSARSRQTRYRN